MREVPAHTLLGPCVVPPAAASGSVQRLLDARRPPHPHIEPLSSGRCCDLELQTAGTGLRADA